MPWYFYLAFKQLFPTGKWVSFFSLMSILGVATGVGVLYGAMSIMNGMQQEIRDSMRSTGGDIRVVNVNGFLYDWRASIERLSEIEGIEAVNPVVEGVVMMVHENKPAFPAILGIDVNASEQVIPFEEKGYLVRGTLDDLYDESVFVGAGLANDLGISIGSTLDIYTPLIAEKLKSNDLILPRDLNVAGIYQTDWGKVDKNTLVVTLRTMQDFYGMGDDVQGLVVRTHPKADLDRVAEAITQALGKDYHALTWLEQNGDFLNILAFEKGMIFIVTVFIILVASLSIASILFATVVSKTREIGLLGALGGRPRGIAAVFALHSLLISCMGLVLGLSAAFLFLQNLNPILRFGLKISGQENAIWQFYEFYNFPIHYSMLDLGIIMGSTLALAMLAGIVPALYAAFMKPSKALRYE